MKKKIQICCSLFFLLFASSFARADGSIAFEDVLPLLRQQSKLNAYILDSLCVSDNGAASRLAGNYPMGGRRIGPYEFFARPKGKQSPYTLKVVIRTSQSFLNKRGKTSTPDRATGLDERLVTIEIKELESPESESTSYNCK